MRAMAERKGWTLISILFSTIPLDQGLSMTLHETALDLYRTDSAVRQVAGDVVSGRVVNLRKTLQIGAISGPAFEAKLETARGSGTVQYLLTREGLDLAGVRAERRPTMLN
jgi:hypothetical protein